MRTLVLGLAAVLLTIANSSPVAASPLGEAFIHLCGETRGDSSQALALAASEGWTTAAPLPGAEAASPPTRIKRIQDGTFLLTAETIATGKGFAMHLCAVSQRPDKTASTTAPDPRAYRDELRAWIGVDPLDNGDRGTGVQFAFRDTASGRIAARPRPRARDLRGQVVVVASAHGGAMEISYMRFQ